MKQPEISVIVPVYNTGQYLARCLDSLVAESEPKTEIICVDNGSTDESAKILAAYAARYPNIKVVSLPENLGAGAARNRGLENASGKYIRFCDSDDWYLPGSNQILYEALKKQKVDVVCAHNAFAYEDESDKETNESRIDREYYNPARKGRFLLDENINVNVMLWNKIFKKSLIDKYAIRFPEHYRHDDDVFWFYYHSVANDIFFLEDEVYAYYIRRNSIMHEMINEKKHLARNPASAKSFTNVTYVVLDFLQKHNLLKDNLDRFYGFASRQFALYMLHGDNLAEEIKKFNRKMKSVGIKKYIVCDDDIKGLYRINGNSSVMVCRIKAWLYRLAYYFSFGSAGKKFHQKAKEYLRAAKMLRNSSQLKDL